MHIHVHIWHIGQRFLFSEKYLVYIIITMTMFVRSQSFISLPSFMLGAAVSEICEWNQNKEFENSYFQFNTFPGHVSLILLG